MKTEIAPLTAEHLNHIVTVVRDADRIEFDYQSDLPMRAVLEDMLQKSHRARVGLIDGEPVCCFGVIRPVVLTTEGHPWMVASRIVEKRENRLAFLRGSRPAMTEMIRGYAHLWNVIHEENRLAIRWLKWLGFKLSDDRFDIGGGWFRRFEMRV